MMMQKCEIESGLREHTEVRNALCYELYHILHYLQNNTQKTHSACNTEG